MCFDVFVTARRPSVRFTRRLFVQLNPSRDRGLDRGASCRFGLLCEHHQLVTWLNVRTLLAARSKRCSSITCTIELFSAARLIRSLGRGVMRVDVCDSRSSESSARRIESPNPYESHRLNRVWHQPINVWFVNILCISAFLPRQCYLPHLRRQF